MKRLLGHASLQKKHTVPPRPKPPTWIQVRARLAALDQPALVALLAELHRAQPDVRIFLGARLGFDVDPLPSYRATIERWACPDVYRGQQPSVSKAKKALTDYARAVGRPEGLAELMTVYCEQASQFATDLAMDDEGFLDALVRMFERALEAVRGLPDDARAPLLDRLREVRDRSRELGYGAGDDIGDLWRRRASGA